MNQKYSVVQTLKFVPQALTSDRVSNAPGNLKRHRSGCRYYTVTILF